MHHAPLIAVLMLLPTTAAAQARSDQDRYAGVDGVEIVDVIGTVEIVLSDRDDVIIETARRGDRPVEVSRSGGALIVRGPDRVDEEAFWDLYAPGIRVGGWRMGGRSIRVTNGRDRRFEKLLEDYPRLTIRAPVGTGLSVEGSAVLLSADGAAGTLGLPGNVYLRGTLGDVDAATVTMSDPGALTLRDVSGAARIDLAGSGDVRFGRADEAAISLRGSGDIEGGDVTGALSVTLVGSGDVEAGRIGGPLTISLRGSGDVEVAEAASGARIELAGSGDIEIERLSGAVEAELRGSGDIEMGEGRANAFRAVLAGSGDISFDGVAVAPILRTAGSGDIVVGEAEGRIDAEGRGIRVGGRSVGAE